MGTILGTYNQIFLFPSHVPLLRTMVITIIITVNNVLIVTIMDSPDTKFLILRQAESHVVTRISNAG